MNYKNHTSVYYAIRKSGDKYKDDVIAIERQLEDDKNKNDKVVGGKDGKMHLDVSK